MKNIVETLINDLSACIWSSNAPLFNFFSLAKWLRFPLNSQIPAIVIQSTKRKCGWHIRTSVRPAHVPTHAFEAYTRSGISRSSLIGMPKQKTERSTETATQRPLNRKTLENMDESTHKARSNLISQLSKQGISTGTDSWAVGDPTDEEFQWFRLIRDLPEKLSRNKIYRLEKSSDTDHPFLD
jgi:hypothetical protein